MLRNLGPGEVRATLVECIVRAFCRHKFHNISAVVMQRGRIEQGRHFARGHDCRLRYAECLRHHRPERRPSPLSIDANNVYFSVAIGSTAAAAGCRRKSCGVAALEQKCACGVVGAREGVCCIVCWSGLAMKDAIMPLGWLPRL